MRLVLAALAAVGLAGCGSDPKESDVSAGNARPIRVTRREQLDGALGKLVTLEGEVAWTKTPTILGVDVASDSPDLRGKWAMATGLLKKWVVTREDLDRELAARGVFAHRGPGTFYRLVESGTGRDAQVQPLP
jgi:hypothetical protein